MGSRNSFVWLFAAALIVAVCAKDVPNWQHLMEQEDDNRMHPVISRKGRSVRFAEEELHAPFWNNGAQNTLRQHLSEAHIKKQAKNVILFLGDGMSIPTLAASRIYQGQLDGQDGEEQTLSFERFPYTGLSRTYCVNSQVADSACSATAYLCGVKANDGTIGVTAAVNQNNCSAMNDPVNQVSSIASWAQAAGKRTGLVTTTRVTHASPAGVYAHIANRNWENDGAVTSSGNDPNVCMDIGKQLITKDPGRKLNVILGGGRGEFRPSTLLDEEGQRGYRVDREDLIAKWRADRAAEGKNAEYVWDRNGLLSVNTDTTEHLLGLFEAGHTRYHLDADLATEPTLEEMTTTAIELLSKGTEGFFLFVEGGRIDHAHHDTTAHKALDETVELAKAVAAARTMTNIEDTLIVVTSDHAHVMTLAGYPERGNPIFAATGVSDKDGLPYSTLSYANGPGYKEGGGGGRYDLRQDDSFDKNYEFPTMVPLSSETHGGDDVAVFASGPWSHLFTGSFEQNYIPHVMAYASCVGEGEKFCEAPVLTNSVNRRGSRPNYMRIPKKGRTDF